MATPLHLVDFGRTWTRPSLVLVVTASLVTVLFGFGLNPKNLLAMKQTASRFLASSVAMWMTSTELEIWRMKLGRKFVSKWMKLTNGALERRSLFATLALTWRFANEVEVVGFSFLRISMLRLCLIWLCPPTV